MPEESLRERAARLPRSPGVYLWKSSAGEVLYVGKAADLRSRTASYFDVTAADKTVRLMADATDLDFIAVRTEKEALLLEQTLIKLHRPRFNVRLTDDKQYPYLKLTGEPYPRLLKVHRREDDGATYFGPFPDGTGAWHVLQAILDLVPLRRCRVLPDEKCLYYDIGKCVAPCIGACTDAEYDLLVAEVRDLLAGRSDHLVERLRERMEEAAQTERFEAAARLRDQVHGLESVLERQHMVHGRSEDRDIAAIAAQGDLAVVVLLHQREGKISGQSAFNLAGVPAENHGEGLADFLRSYYQDRAVPRHVAGEFGVQGPALEADLRLLAGGAVDVEVPQKGDKRRWLDVAATNAALRLQEELHRRARRGAGALEALQQALGLATLPRVIEGFDVSHSAGRHTRAAMVRFVDGKPDKAGYRMFGMKSVGEDAVAAGTAELRRGAGREVDDFASIGEAVRRRYRGVLERQEPLPDLVLVDGGPGQLAAARSALQGLQLQHVAVCSLAKQEEEIFLANRLHALRLKRDDPALQLLQRVRDEAHRFGITQVRRKASSSTMESPLDAVAGIGPKRRIELVKAFGGLEGLRAANTTDLQKVKGVTPAIADAIVAALRQ